MNGDEKQSLGKSFILAAHSMVGTGNNGKRKKTKKQKSQFQRHILDPKNKNTLPESGSDLSLSEASDLELEGSSNKPKRSRIDTENVSVN